MAEKDGDAFVKMTQQIPAVWFHKPQIDGTGMKDEHLLRHLKHLLSYRGLNLRWRISPVELVGQNRHKR
jgi:hypothetical protein